MNSKNKNIDTKQQHLYTHWSFCKSVPQQPKGSGIISGGNFILEQYDGTKKEGVLNRTMNSSKGICYDLPIPTFPRR